MFRGQERTLKFQREKMLHEAFRRSSSYTVPKVPLHYSRSLVQRFTSLLAESEQSITGLLRANPELPCLNTLQRWRDKYPAFARAWKRAREAQAEHLMQKCFDLAEQADKSNAHAMRIKFDIYRFNASKMLPALYGDKGSESHVSVSTAVVISPERLNAIRGSLERARGQFIEVSEGKSRREERKALYPQSLLEHDKRNGEHRATSESDNQESNPLSLTHGA